MPRGVPARVLDGEVELFLVHHYRLLIERLPPRFLRHVLEDALAELAGIGREIEPLGLAPELDALHHPCHGRCSVPAAAIILARIVFTENIAWGSDPFHQNLRAPLVVVQLLLFLRQRRYRRLGKTALDEPVRRARREHEELLQSSGARQGLDVPQQALPVALVAAIR